jgi:hypothetical protein
MLAAVVLGAVLWYSNKHTAAPEPHFFPTAVEKAPGKFHCEGKTRCSQMTSCDEATFYLRNCSGTQMDGDADGVPCESHHCRR